MNKKISFVLAVLLLSFMCVSPAQALTSGLYLGGQTYTLSGAGISSSASSINLTSLTLPQNGYKILDADLDSTFHVTIEPGNRTRQEFVDCTTATQNGGGTATLSGCTRGISGVYPYTASTTQAFSHSGGSTLVFSNSPNIYRDLYDYANTLSFSGAADASLTQKGVAELASGAEAAASTASGSSGVLVIPASIATSTYNTATAANRVIVTNGSGLIDPKFVFNGVSYTFPASQGALSTSLINDGNGALSWSAPSVQALIASTSINATIVNQTATTSIYTGVIPANTINGSSKVLRATAYVAQPNAAQACGFDLIYGNGSASTTVGTIAYQSGIGEGFIIGTMFATSTSAQGWTSLGYLIPNQTISKLGTPYIGAKYTAIDLTAKSYLSLSGAVISSGTCKINSFLVEVLSQ